MVKIQSCNQTEFGLNPYSATYLLHNLSWCLTFLIYTMENNTDLKKRLKEVR